MPGQAPTLSEAAAAGFLHGAPRAYRLALLGALLVNPLLFWLAGPVITGWALVAEFIATLALALQCHPLAPGGLLALEAVMLGLATPAAVYHEVESGLPILLLLLFMVAAIGFMDELLVWLFGSLLRRVRSQSALALLFCAGAALLSAFLDALTVIAVVMSVVLGLYRIWFQLAAQLAHATDHQLGEDLLVPESQRAELQQLRAALRGLLMHAAVGTALGGVCTLVGEPQNLLIGHRMGWDFMRFAREVAPVALPVLAAGLLTCALLEWRGWFGFGVAIPAGVRAVLAAQAAREAGQRTQRMRWRLIVQALVALLLVVALARHWAEVGLIGLMCVVLLAALMGETSEHRLAERMKVALPFAALLVVFFVIVALINAQGLFRPVVGAVLAQQGAAQSAWMYLANGLLSAISDNVFVATIYSGELQQAMQAGAVAPEQAARLAVAINAGTNIPSIATPNGQAAFLFLLTSAVAPLLRLSYARMCWMALPYFAVTTPAGLAAVVWLLH